MPALVLLVPRWVRIITVTVGVADLTVGPVDDYFDMFTTSLIACTINCLALSIVVLMGIEIRVFLVVDAFSQISGTRFAENG